MDDELARLFLQSVETRLRKDKALADAAMAQCTFEQLRAEPWPDQNSVAVIVKHLAGNMRSRFTDYLTTDGEKPWRNRDDEFVDDIASKEDLLARWEAGWACCFAAIAALTPADLARTVTVRGEPMGVMDSLHRHMTHAGYHIGQIVALCRKEVGPAWRTLTIARGGSAQFNKEMHQRHERR